MRLLPIRDICIKILKDKKFIEDIDTFNYVIVIYGKIMRLDFVIV